MWFIGSWSFLVLYYVQSIEKKYTNFFFVTVLWSWRWNIQVYFAQKHFNQRVCIFYQWNKCSSFLLVFISLGLVNNNKMCTSFFLCIHVILCNHISGIIYLNISGFRDLFEILKQVNHWSQWSKSLTTNYKTSDFNCKHQIIILRKFTSYLGANPRPTP